MKPKDILILAIALVLVSALVGLIVLFYLYVWGAPSATGATPATASAIVPSPTIDPLAATQTPLPSLVTPTNTPTSSPTPTPSLTPSPTWTPTPSPSPSPSPIPAARLANARRAKRNGDYRLARNEFRIVLESPEAKGEAIEALFELGVCALLDGEHAAARDLLLQFTIEHAQDHRAAAAHFHLAQALEELGDHVGEIEHYRAYLNQQDVLADLVYTRIGDTLMAQQDYEAAIQAYTSALKHAPDLEQQYDLREQIGVAYSAWGRFEESIDWLGEITERSQNVYRLARVWYLIGQVYRMAGKETEALDAFSRAVYGDPRPGYAHAALITLVEAHVEVNEYQRGLIDYYAESYGAAVTAFHQYIENTPDYNSDAHYYTALSYFDSGSYDLAVQECEHALSKFPDTIPHWGEMWLLWAQALARQDRVDDAVAIYIEFADTHSDHPLAPKARWNAAQLLERQEMFGEAADTYTTLADRHVNADQAPAARFRAGLSRYRTGDVDAALVAWRELANGYPGTITARQGRYWLGKVLWAQGEAVKARTILQNLADAHPRDYYGLRAAHLLDNNGQPIHWSVLPGSIHWTSDEQAEQREVEAWFSSWETISKDKNSVTTPTELDDDIHFRRGTELLNLGLRAQARDEFKELRKEISQDPIELYRFALLTRDLGLYAPSLRATINLIIMAPEDSVLEMPRLIQRLAFPVYFDELVTSESEAYGVDPLLMFALIRQESVFDDQVDSWAGAIGLAQIMPATGEWIAEMMSWPEYKEAYLRRAYLNVKFGAWFMSRILEMTKGDIAAALAGYNGGPGNGVYWLEESGGDPDLFVEIINYDEPQLYVREIYRHYDVYVHLYGSGQEN